MKLKCLSVISDFNNAFKKGDIYEASEIRYEMCDVVGDRKKRNGTDWTGVLSLGHIVVLGVAKFSILEEDSDEDSE